MPDPFKAFKGWLLDWLLACFGEFLLLLLLILQLSVVALAIVAVLLLLLLLLPGWITQAIVYDSGVDIEWNV